MIFRQTAALLLDAYRELNAKKLFWLVLAISLLVIGVVASMGINAKGMTFLHWQLGGWTTEFISEADFYRLLFTTFAIPVWLAWGATILALVSTSSIIPDMITGGSIESMLSRPISRTRLFLTKYLAALLFVVLQVAAFSIAGLLVMAIRAGEMEWGLLLAIPIVTLFYSYLYCLCALFGLLTRSTITALLLTLMVWLLLFGFQTSEHLLMQVYVSREVRVAKIETAQQETDQEIADLQSQLLETRASLQALQAAPTAANEKERRQQIRDVEGLERGLGRLRDYQEDLTTQAAAAQESLEMWRPWYRLAGIVRWVLPKNAETIGLLDRYLLDHGDTPLSRAEDQEPAGLAGLLESGEQPGAIQATEDEVMAALDTRFRQSSLFWIIGTSLLFEAVILTIACWKFARRDF